MKRSWLTALSAGVLLFSISSAFAVKAPPKAEERPQAEERSGHKLDYSASVVFGTDYVFRGISLTDEEFAVQGTLDIRSSTGLYVGAFASNVDFNDGDEANTELDYYGGYAGKITQRLGYNLNATYSTFPGADDDLHYDNFEVSPSLTYEVGEFYLHGGVVYSPDYFGNSGDAFYYDSNLEWGLPYAVTLGLHGGYQTVQENDTFGVQDYADWAVTLKKAILGFEAAVSYVNTNLDKDDCFGGADICDGRVVFSIGGHGLSPVRSRNAPVDKAALEKAEPAKPLPSKPGKT
jgi:uncharacterized protein (TIGR02001 family)